MEGPRNGFEYLQLLKEKAKDGQPSFIKFERYLDIKARDRRIPISGQFELTPLCNFDCRMCYVHLTKEQMKDLPVLPVAKWKKLIAQAFNAGMFRATLSGGECLSHPGFKEIYLYLQSLGCEVTVLTNGSLLDGEYVRFFKEHMPRMIRITLYGYDEDSYERVTGRRCFGEVCDHIRQIREAGLPLTISVTPNKFLGEGVFETMRTAKSLCPNLKISNSLFNPRQETGRAGQENDVDLEYYRRIHELYNSLNGMECIEIPEDQLPEPGGPSHECSETGLLCGGGMSSFSIDWKGNMHPCERMPEVEAYPLRDGFKTAWESINQTARSWPRVPECDGCAYFPTCIICAAYMRTFAEPGRQPLGLCRRTRYLVQHGVWHLPDCT